MGVDTDLVGVITASAVVGVCMCVVIVLASCVCHSRLESKRRKAEKRRASSMVMVYSPPAGDGDMTMDQATRIGGYRPRMLSPNSPRSSASIYNVNNTRSSLPPGTGNSSINGTPRHHHQHHQQQSPRADYHYPQSSTTPLYSNNVHANGHVMVPISMVDHYRMVNGLETQDYYDARANTMPIRPYQICEDFVETEYHPDEIFDTAIHQQHQKKQQTSPHPSQEGGPKDVDSPSHPTTQQVDNAGLNGTGENGMVDVEIEEIKSSDNDNKQTTESAMDKGRVSTLVNGDVDPNTEEISTHNTSQYKVIKKQHAHVRMPEWMVREYEEAESSLEVEEEESSPALGQGVRRATKEDNQEPGLVSVMVEDYSKSIGESSDPSQNPNNNNNNTTKAGAVLMSYSTTVDESTTSVVQDYSSTNYIKDFTILDYVDPLPPPLPLPPPPPPSDLNETLLEEPTSPRTEASSYDDNIATYDDNNTVTNYNTMNNTNHDDDNDNTDDVDDESDQAIKERKAAVLRQIRQKVNESAERMPPVFTSTPRVDPEEAVEEDIPTSDALPPPPPLPPPTLDEYGLSRRQRSENEGSLDDLPPMIADTKL